MAFGDVEQQRRVVVDALEARFGDVVDRQTLDAVVQADFSRYAQARVKDFVPVLVERDVSARLRHTVAS
jgi:hypothetical protein